MKQTIRLQIPQTCGEDWGQMEKRPEGRHCQACQKTVVDFTTMSDDEIFRYFERVGSKGLCGRLLPEQMGRDLHPAAVRRNGWSGWKWLVASALMWVRPPEGGKPAKPAVAERKVVSQPSGEAQSISAGMVLHVGKRPGRKMRDLSKPDWKFVPAKMESVAPREVPPIRADLVPRESKREESKLEGFAGAVVVGAIVKRRYTSGILTKLVADTMSSLNIFKKEDFLTLYPNPIGRGETMHLAWLSDAGKYQLALMNMRGQMVDTREAEIGGHGQVDQWTLPTSLAAGVYVLRIIKAGSGRVEAREIVVN